MAKPKAQTLQMRFGFADKDLKLPEHDEIMLWVDSNLEDVLSLALGHLVSNAKSKWEHPIKSGDFIVGFVDMRVTGCYVKSSTDEDGQLRTYNDDRLGVYIEIKTSIPSLGELLRQINMYRTYIRDGSFRHVGESAYFSKWEFLVISPDNRHKSKLAEQGIKFFKYDLTLDLSDKIMF